MIQIKAEWEKNSKHSEDIWRLYDKIICNINLKEKLEEYREAIKRESEELGKYLFDSNQLNEDHLNALLRTRTDTKTLKGNKLVFNLSPGLTKWDMVKTVFDYSKFSRSTDFPKLIQMLHVETCPYCNRAYTTTVEKSDGSFYRQNQADHYKSQNHYPYLALTLPNLIPVCAACNIHKSYTDEDVLYPYNEGFGNNFAFMTHPVSGYGYLVGELKKEDSFEVRIEKTANAVCDADYDNRVVNAVRRFGLGVIYSAHNHYVLDIFRQRYIFGDEYINDLCASFPDLFSTPEDVRELLYMKTLADDQLNASPLSLLTRDIDREITRLTW